MSGSIAEEIRQGALKELDRIADEAVEIMRSECPQKGKNVWTTGNLAKSIHKESEGEFVRLVGTDVPYAKFVEHGRRDVRPVRAKALYLKGLNIWTDYASFAPAQNFVEKTIAKLK